MTSEGDVPRKCKGKVIVVEDAEFIRGAIVHSLAIQGFDVESAADGQEAFERISSSRDSYFALVADLDMPRMRGDELIEELDRLLIPFCAYIVISAHSDDHPDIAQLRSRDSRVPLFFLPKPFDTDTLTALLESILTNGSKGSTR